MKTLSIKGVILKPSRSVKIVSVKKLDHFEGMKYVREDGISVEIDDTFAEKFPQLLVSTRKIPLF